MRSAFLTRVCTLVVLSAFMTVFGAGAAAAAGKADAEYLPPGDFDPRKALELVFPKLETKDDVLRWMPPEEMRKALGPEPFQVSVLSAQAFRQGDADRTYLVVQLVQELEQGFDCHGCQPGIGAATFTSTEEGWRLDALNRYAGDVGSWGKAPEPEIVKLGPERYGIAFQSMYVGQGNAHVSETYFLEAGNSVDEVLFIETHWDNSGRCIPEDEEAERCTEFDSTLEFVPGKNAEIFDLKVTKTATHDESFREETLYTYVDGKYQTTSP